MGGSQRREKAGISARKPKQITSCENLVINTQLKSPVEEVLSKIKEGDLLDITVIAPDECVALYDGSIAGKIVCFDLKELLDCLKLGNTYTATVRNINGLRCSLTIKR
jgi:hypothetical protein